MYIVKIAIIVEQQAFKNGLIIKIILLILLSTVTFHNYAQEPRIGYYFKIFDKDNREVTDSNKTYRLKSLYLKSHSKTINDTVFYNIEDREGDVKSMGYWMISQEFRNIRNYLWIQIMETEKKDTMNIFLNKYNKYSFYGNPNKDPDYNLKADSIGFQKGNFEILKQPQFNDWKKKSKSLKKIKGSMETFFNKEFDKYGNRRN